MQMHWTASNRIESQMTFQGFISTLLIATAPVFIAGCITPQDMYTGLQTREKEKCQSIPNQDEYRRCISRNDMSQQRYEAERKKIANQP